MTKQMARSDVRVLIIDDHALFAESLELALAVEGYDARRARDLEGGASPKAALAAAIRMRPFIVLLDLDLGQQGDGVGMVAPLVAAGVQVVVVTGSTDAARWGECLGHGARQVLPKTHPLNEILAVVRRINQGLPVLDRAERERLVRLWVEQRRERAGRDVRLRSLTRREQEVLGHLMQGRCVRDIARLGVVSEATVRTQVKSILAKLEVSSQLAAVGMAHSVGWHAADPVAV